MHPTIFLKKRLSHHGNVRVIRYGAAYGHNTMSISVDGISVDSDLTVGISFSFEMTCDKIFEYRYTKEY